MGRPKKKIREMQKADLRYHIPAESLYIALDELNFAWFQHEIDTVKDMWQQGDDIREIASKVDRLQEEVAILIMDLRMKDEIYVREKGVFGGD